MHKRADGVYKAPFNINTAARAWAVRVRQRPGPRAIKTPRRACAQAVCAHPSTKSRERHRGGWRKNTRVVLILRIYYIEHPCACLPKGEKLT